MFSTMRSATVLAIGGLLATTMVGAAADPVEVSGTSLCTRTNTGQWTGALVPGGAFERLSEMTQECTMETSDPRLTGDAENVVDCRYAVVDGVLVGECWGTSVMRTEDGAWAGVFSGTTRDEPGAKDPMELVYLGSGDHAGLRFVGSVTTNETPGILTGQIESIE